MNICAFIGVLIKQRDLSGLLRNCVLESRIFLTGAADVSAKLRGKFYDFLKNLTFLCKRMRFHS